MSKKESAESVVREIRRKTRKKYSAEEKSLHVTVPPPQAHQVYGRLAWCKVTFTRDPGPTFQGQAECLHITG